MVFQQGAGVEPMELHIEKESDSTKTHSHSNSANHHDDVQDSNSSKKAIPGKGQHVHSNSENNLINNHDSIKRKDSIEIKEKKKKLKEMKY